MYMMYYVCLLWRRGSSGPPPQYTHTYQLPRKVKLFCTWWERSFLESSICPICRNGPSRCNSGPRLLGSHPGNETPIVECRQEKDGYPPLLRAPSSFLPRCPQERGHQDRQMSPRVAEFLVAAGVRTAGVRSRPRLPQGILLCSFGFGEPKHIQAMTLGQTCAELLGSRRAPSHTRQPGHSEVQ